MDLFKKLFEQDLLATKMPLNLSELATLVFYLILGSVSTFNFQGFRTQEKECAFIFSPNALVSFIEPNSWE